MKKMADELRVLQATLERLRATTTPHIHRRGEVSVDWNYVESVVAMLLVREETDRLASPVWETVGESDGST